MRHKKQRMPFAATLAAALLMAGAAGADREPTRTTVDGKPGKSCDKTTKKVFDGKVSGLSIVVCWSTGGDPALNGVEVIVDVRGPKKQRLTWRNVLDVYDVKKVTPRTKDTLEIRTLEHHMNDENQVVTRKATYTLVLTRDKAGAVQRTLQITRAP